LILQGKKKVHLTENREEKENPISTKQYFSSDFSLHIAIALESNQIMFSYSNLCWENEHLLN